jgi:predicted aconitase
MHLTKEEERVCDGEYGWANQICMKILVRLGDLFKAERLIPIDSAHVSGVSYKTLGDAPIEFLQALADADAHVKTRATLNPQSLDPEYLSKRLKQEVVDKQLCILDQFDRMGFTPSLTCTPYYLHKHASGSHLAWAESSAVIYANSVIGAWTNREGGPSALAAAIIGKTPDYGMHRVENRKPSVLVKVEPRLRNESEYGALGIYLGKILQDKTPLIMGLHRPSEIDLKQLGAAIGSSGMVSMFKTENRHSKKVDIERIEVDSKTIEKTVESLSTASGAKPDLVFIGCPHCSFGEIKRIAGLMEGKKVKAGLEFWVCTSRSVKEKASRYVKIIENCGGHVLAGVCTIVSWTEALGIRTIMTNSAKTAYYAPTLCKAQTALASLEECVATALRG